MASDPRITASNGRVALRALQGQVMADEFLDGTWMTVQQPLANIMTEPKGTRASQLLFGERFLALETRDGQVFGQAERDGQVGYILLQALAAETPVTHWVTAPATHLYPRPDVKSSPDVSIFFGARVNVVEPAKEGESFHRIQTGHHVPKSHLRPLTARFSDTVGVADLFLGTPYLWGGSSRWGIDCSGLIQLAMRACGQDCPRDSDQQEAALGALLPEDAPLRRGDLVFWRGHVGIMADEEMLLHANAHHMAVAYEPLAHAEARIRTSGGGEITAGKHVLIE